MTATPLCPGPERTAVIVATARQQPFPGNVVYRLARPHILAVGRYFRLDPPVERLARVAPASGRTFADDG